MIEERKTKIAAGDYVMTSKGNHGRVKSILGERAMVQIGYKLNEIDLYNLVSINDGTTIEVVYNDGIKTCKSTTFLKHGTILYDGKGIRSVVTQIELDLRSKLQNKLVVIEQLLIP